MDFYNFISTFVLPLTITHFSIDYLSDNEITRSETKIGIIQYIHHFIVNFNLIGVLVLPFINADLLTLYTSVLVSVIAQGGYLMNQEQCWITKYVNKLICGRSNRKWIADFSSFMKYYTRGESWAQSDVYGKIDNTLKVTIMNVLFLFVLIKYMKKNKMV